jgi:hypothetical protein
MAALHDASAGYYTAANNASGHPSDAMGYALGVGLRINAPMIGAGDYFQGQFNWAKGASKYVANSPAGGAMSAYGGKNSTANNNGSWGYGVYSDAVYSTTAGSSLELTSIWGVNAAYEHFWNKAWQTSIWGAYNKTTYSTAANTTICAALTTATWTVAPASCTNDFSVLALGTRTQWNVDSTTYIGLEVVYTKLYTASGGQTATLAASGSQLAGVRNIENQDAWATRFQIHRNFYP